MAKKSGFAGRIRGTLKPSFTTSSAQLFAKRGDEWLTPKEKDKEFPLRRSIPADPPKSPQQEQADIIRQRTKQARRKSLIEHKRQELGRAVSRGDIPATARLMDELEYLHENKGQDTVDFAPPRAHLHVDPDLDAYTKASRAVPKEKFIDPPRKPIEVDAQRKAANALIKMRREMRGTVVTEKTPRPKKVKGSFYRFDDITEKIKDQTKYNPRPFFGEKKK